MQKLMGVVWTAALWLVGAMPCRAQDSSNPAVTVAPSADPPKEDRRVFGVIPNNRTTEASLPFTPISVKLKMTIAYRDSFDWPTYPTAAAFALLYQLENQSPSFGQGVQGYAKRFATACGDQLVGNMMTEGIMPALTHEDPRYFRLATGTTWHRLGYALSRILVTRTDSGRTIFNFS